MKWVTWSNSSINSEDLSWLNSEIIACMATWIKETFSLIIKTEPSQCTSRHFKWFISYPQVLPGSWCYKTCSFVDMVWVLSCSFSSRWLYQVIILGESEFPKMSPRHTPLAVWLLQTSCICTCEGHVSILFELQLRWDACGLPICYREGERGRFPPRLCLMFLEQSKRFPWVPLG